MSVWILICEYELKQNKKKKKKKRKEKTLTKDGYRFGSCMSIMTTLTSLSDRFLGHLLSNAAAPTGNKHQFLLVLPWLCRMPIIENVTRQQRTGLVGRVSCQKPVEAWFHALPSFGQH